MCFLITEHKLTVRGFVFEKKIWRPSLGLLKVDYNHCSMGSEWLNNHFGYIHGCANIWVQRYNTFFFNSRCHALKEIENDSFVPIITSLNARQSLKIVSTLLQLP